jgi:peptidoglycan/xylan/chitin deacetylase (PgdA/CDA1 family)
MLEFRRYGIKMFRKLSTLPMRSGLGTITHVTTRDPVVALTFDDGPDPEYTPRLLDILENHGARGTFFMTGEAAHRHPEVVKRVAQAGHAIGNHSWDHPCFPLISSRERRAQIRACANALAPYGDRLFRPPYGDQNIVSRIDALLLGYKVIMFNVTTDDWCGGDAASIADQVERRIHPGSVIALHDKLSDALDASYFNREPVLEAVRILLERLGERFRFVTIPELLRHGQAQKEIWYKEADLELLNKLRRSEGPGRRYAEHGRNHWLVSLLNIQLR